MEEVGQLAGLCGVARVLGEVVGSGSAVDGPGPLQ